MKKLTPFILAGALLFAAIPSSAAEIPPGLARAAALPAADAKAEALDRVELAELARTDLQQQGGMLSRDEKTIILVVVVIIAILIIA